jgi:hypothetical protein
MAGVRPSGRGLVRGTPGHGRADRPADSERRGRAPGLPAAWATGTVPHPPQVAAQSAPLPGPRRWIAASGRRRRRPRHPTVQIGANKARGTSPGHRAGSPCRLWLSRRVPLMETLDRASAGGRTQPTRPVGPEKTRSTIVRADGMLRAQAQLCILPIRPCAVWGRVWKDDAAFNSNHRS